MSQTRTAKTNEYPTFLYKGQLAGLLHILKAGPPYNAFDWTIWAEFGRIFEALLNGKAIIFSPEPEPPF